MRNAVAFAKRRGVVIGDDVIFVSDPVDDIFLKPWEMAHFGIAYSNHERYRWADLLDEDGKVSVRVHSAVLASDEHILSVLAHEMYEINELRRMFEETETISGAELIRLVRRDQPPNLHSEANDAGSACALALRREREGRRAG